MGSILMATKGMILVTGCSGLVGTHLCQKLEENGYSVVGVDIKYSQELPATEQFQYHNIDLRDADDVRVLFDQYEFTGVINAFGIKGSPIRAKEKPIDFLEPSIKVNTNIIDNCVRTNCWLVYMSSVGVYEPAEVFEESSVWKTLPSPNDWFPSWSKRIPELYLEAFKVQEKYEKFNGKLGCFAPCKNGEFLIGLDLSFYIYNPLSQNLSKFVDLKDEPQENRINDGTTDPKGRFWVGTMTSEGNTKKQSGSIYCIFPDRKVPVVSMTAPQIIFPLDSVSIPLIIFLFPLELINISITSSSIISTPSFEIIFEMERL